MYMAGRCVEAYNLRTGTKRLLTENMVPTLNGLDSLLGMHSRRTSNNNSLQALLLIQHLVVVLVRAHARELLLRGVELGLHGRADGDELGARGEGCEVAGMAHACYPC